MPTDLDRRRFLKLGLSAGAGAFIFRPPSAQAYGTEGALYRALVPEGATPAAKGINASWLASLNLRESGEPVFTKAANELRYIGMPVGGIGCGTLYLGGDGRLWLWDVWHKSGEGIRPRSRTYQRPDGGTANCANRDGVNYFDPIDAWENNPAADKKPLPFSQGFALQTVKDGVDSMRYLDQRGFSNVSFRGSYPLAKVDYSDAACPLDVSLTAHPIFIPLDSPASSLPVTVMEYTLHNPGTVPIDATVCGWMENPVLWDTGVPAGVARNNVVRSGSSMAFLECRADGVAFVPYAPASDYQVLGAFESTGFNDWTTTGTAFGSGPVTVPSPTNPSPDLRDVRAVGSKFANSYLGNGDSDAPTGTLTSPAFFITKSCIHFLMGGGAVSGIRVRLLDASTGAELRSASNSANGSTMKWRRWDVADLMGREVRISVEDSATGSWGQLDVDHFCSSDNPLAPEYVIFDDFERSAYAPWTTTGTAFGSGPIRIGDLPSYQGDVKGLGGRVVNSHASAPGASINEKDAKTGTLVSPVFTVTHGYLHWLQGGGSTSADVRVRLLRASDNVELRIQSGNDSNAMSWRTWDLRDLRGQSVRISIEDLRSGSWGNIGVDQILFSTNPAAPSAPTAVESAVDAGTIGIAELGSATGRSTAASNVASVFPWLPQVPAGSGAIGRTVTLSPGASSTVRFLVAWHFPNLPAGLPGTRREYANRFNDAFAVASHVADNFNDLAGKTRLWVDTWKDSSLPYWFLDRSLATACTLATTNCFLFSSGRFYGYEGVNCCAGTCTHVWYYAQSPARLFPDLERGLRQNVDLNSAVALRADGSVKFRGEYNNDWAWDGQAGTVLRSYREHLCAADSSFLATNWTNIRKVVDFLIGEDGNQDGVSEARQHNTLDADWYGRVPAHISLYGAALEAAAAMASSMGETSYAATCSGLAASARARMAERHVASTTDPLYGFGYHTQLLTGTAGQLGHVQGCYIDQVIGEFYSRQLGLPRVTDSTQCRNSLRSIWRFNYSHNLTTFLSSTAIRQGRPYQMSGEAGLLICTFPNDGNQWSSSWQSGYFAECMTGFEYQVAAHCLSEGLGDEGLMIMRAVYDRYHPAKRNPFNEIECSDHYARAMASYGCFLASCGFRYDGPRGMIGFAPKFNADSFKSAFTAAQGWGSYQRSKAGGLIREALTLRHGTLRLRYYEGELAEGHTTFLASARVNGNDLAASFVLSGSTLRCTLAAEIVLGPGDVFEVVHTSSSQPAVTDTDTDGLSDLEEASGINDPATPEYDPRGNLTDPANPDTDEDGTSDGNEARLGTNPLSSTEFFRGLPGRDPQGRPTVSWPSKSGTRFSVFRGSNLVDWTPVATGIPGEAGSTAFTDNAAPEGAGAVFYRVLLEP